MFYNFDDGNDTFQHFDFRPNNSYVETTNYEKSDEFEKLLNIFDEIIENAKNWCALGAFERWIRSRLILVKLLSNCTNIGCFTYGPYGNFEASKLKKHWRKLSVEWHRSIDSNEIREIYNDEATQRYINSAFQGSSAFGGFFAIFKLKKLGIFKSGDIVINGQSGDLYEVTSQTIYRIRMLVMKTLIC